MKYIISLFLTAALFLLPAAAAAHTMVLIPRVDQNGRKTVKAVFFHPAIGDNIMGIRLGVDDSSKLKGLDEIYMIHEKQKKTLNHTAVPDYYTVRDEKRESYTIRLNKESGFFKPGDYIIVVKHKPHWKKHEGLYREKVAKLCLNYFGVTSDWPDRVLKNMPEIIPLVQPYSVQAGTIFRAEAVNEKGRRIPHAEINIEYLNYPAAETELETSKEGFLEEELADTTVFTDGSGSFSFIPPRKGLWTFTLVNGDSGKLIQGKEVEYDSSLSVLVK